MYAPIVGDLLLHPVNDTVLAQVIDQLQLTCGKRW